MVIYGLVMQGQPLMVILLFLILLSTMVIGESKISIILFVEQRCGHPVSHLHVLAVDYDDDDENREVDIAMTTLFGSLAPEFYDSYQKEWPLPPGYEKRKVIYNLYHIMNHIGKSVRPRVRWLVFFSYVSLYLFHFPVDLFIKYYLEVDIDRKPNG